MWQRRWTPEVRAAVAGATGWDGLVVLVAEVDADGEVHGTEALGPRGAEALAQAGSTVPRTAISLAIRVGALPKDGGLRLRRLAAAAVAEARARGLPPASVHLDLDAPTARLGELVELVAALQADLAPLPVEVLALPDWARAPELPALSAAAGALIVQVHGLDRRGPGAAPVVFDAAAARAAEAYASLGKPYEVALPVHRWTLAAGEGWTRAQAGPADLAATVRRWTDTPPDGLGGLCWFRLPVPGDRGSWPAAAVDALRRGETPEGELQIEIVDEGAGSHTVWARASGALPSALSPLSLSGPEISAGDALRGGRWSLEGEEIRWSPLPGDELWPGEEAALGWVRAGGPVVLRDSGAAAAPAGPR